MDWSHQILDPGEQTIFRRLAVFAGGFTLEAIRAVVDPFAKLEHPLEDGAEALVNQSLLQVREGPDGEQRFSMLETMREYAFEKLVATGEADSTQKAHAAYFLVVAEEGAVALGSSGQPAWLRRLEEDHDNLRAALDWLTAHRLAEWGLRLAIGLFRFWERGEHLVEGRRRLRAILELEGARAFPSLRAKALFAEGILACSQSDIDTALPLHTECLRIFQELGDSKGEVVALVALGNYWVAKGECDKARVPLERSLEIWQAMGDEAGFARSLSNLAYVGREQGRFREARALYRRAASIFDRLGDPLSRAWAANHEGDVAREQGETEVAERLYDVALEAFQSLENAWGIGSSLADLGAIARQRGDHATASRLYRCALASFVELDHRRGIARLLESLACLAAEEGRAERGLQLAAAAARLRDTIGAPLPRAGQADLQRSLLLMRQRLGTEAARSIWQAGSALSVEEAIELVGSC